MKKTISFLAVVLLVCGCGPTVSFDRLKELSAASCGCLILLESPDDLDTKCQTEETAFGSEMKTLEEQIDYYKSDSAYYIQLSGELLDVYKDHLGCKLEAIETVYQREAEKMRWQ